MAIYNLDNYLDKDGLGFPLNFRRGNPNPLDNSSVWGSFAAAQNYAQTDPVAYVGQILTVVEDVVVGEATVKTATAYVIDNEAGDLKEVGSSPVGDEKTITVSEDGTVSLYGIAGLALTREEEDGSTTKINYQPLLVDGKLTWVEPSATTVEGLATEIEGLKTRLGAVETIVGKSAEGDAEATGLVKAVATLEEKVGEKAVSEQIADYVEEQNIRGVIVRGTAPTKDTAGAPGQIYAWDNGAGVYIYVCKGYYVPMGDISGYYVWEHINISGINLSLETLRGEDEMLWESIELIEEDYLTSADKKAIEAKIPTNVSALTNDSKYQTDTEVLATVNAKISEINHAVFQKVDAIPAIDDAETNVLYIVPEKDDEGAETGKLNIYAKIGEEMVLIDDTDADLNGYAKTEDIEEALGKAHEHANKALLDTYTQTEEDLADAVAKKHEHANADVLKDITAEKVAAWDEAEKNVIAVVDESQFNVGEDRKLTLLDVDMSKVAGLSDALDGKVDKAGGYRLMAETEGTKLAGIAEGAQVNAIDTVDEAQFDITGKHLTLLDIAIGKVTGLSDALDGKVAKVAGSRLLTEDEATKLEKLVLGENGEVSVSGKVAAGNVEGLDTWITTRAATLEGLSENNFTDTLLGKLEGVEAGAQVNYINEVSDEFTVTGKKLSVSAIAQDKVTGLGDALAGKVDAQEGYGLISDAERAKLEGVAEGAQVNVVEGVKVGGTLLDIVDKVVDIPVATTTVLGVVMSSAAENKVAVAEDGTMEVNSVNINKLVQTAGDTLVLDGGASK